MSDVKKSVTLDEVAKEVAAAEQEKVEEEKKEEESKEMDAVVYDPNAPIITIKKLIDAGVHYGHQTRKWNPKMNKYIYCARNGIYLIDLVKTKAAIENAYATLKNIVNEGGKVLLVGTKDAVKDTVRLEAERSGSFYVNSRWLGGTLTNFKTISTRIRRLKELEDASNNGDWDNLPKKEAILLGKEKDKLAKNLEGIKEMRKVPNAIIVCDPTDENIAVLEAKKLGIPVFGLCDTNCDPDNITHVIPSNNDADKALKLLLGVLCDAIVEAKGGLPEIAYTKDEGVESTMNDALKQADRENALRLAARREMQRERLEKQNARFQNKFAQKQEAEKAKAEKPAEEEAKVEDKGE